MSTQARYVGAWGFSVPLYGLWRAAFAWKDVRIFRLVVIRHQSAAYNGPSLASLPVEVLNIIESELLKQGMRDAFNDTPKDGCVCDDVFKNFDEEPHVIGAFQDFCEEMDHDAEKVPRKEIWSQFVLSRHYEDLSEAHFDEHVMEGCESESAGRDFWKELFLSCVDGNVYGDNVMLHDFLADFHMQMPRFKHPSSAYSDGPFFDYFDDPFIEHENELVNLVLCPTKCWYAMRPEPVVPGPFVVNEATLFFKLRLYGIMPQGVKKKGAGVSIPLKWSLRRYKGDPIDLSGKKLISAQLKEEGHNDANKAEEDQSKVVNDR